MKTIDLSIIIPVYNAALSIERCLNSIFKQDTQYTYEVILIDDGSSDDSVNIIKKIRGKNILLHQQNNAGPSVARNKGIELSKGRYCAFLDADDYWINGFIEKTINFLDLHSECIAVNVAQKHLTVSGKSFIPSCYNQYSSPFILTDFFTFWANYMHVCTGSVVIRNDKLKDIGGMRTDLRITEDLELWALISTYGQWGFIPEILFVSDGGDTTHSIGWLNKMKIRWNNAPSIEVWERRIIKHLPKKLPLSYLKARGRISRNLTYCQILSGRLSLSRKEALKYGIFFDKDIIGIMMNIAKYNSFTWWILAQLLHFREFHRK